MTDRVDHRPFAELALQVRSAQQGERSASRALFERFQAGVVAFCLLSVKGDRDTALDLTQEIFSRAFKGLPELKEPAAFKGWLYAIAANVVRSRGAQETRRREVLEGFALQQAVEEAAFDEPEPERSERLEQVRKLVEKVEDEKVRAIADAHYLQGRKTREIATAMGIPHGTVTVKLMRFRDRMKRELCRLAVTQEAS